MEHQPRCIFCGGSTKAVTKEHCPPRSLFQKKEWPEGFEFPACHHCNYGTRNDDVLAALLGRLDPFENKGDGDGRLIGLMLNAKRQHLGLLNQMLNMGAIESRKAARQLGIKRPPGMTYQQAGIVKVTKHMDKAVGTLASKLTKALYFRETGAIFPRDGAIQLHWFTNAVLYKHGSSPVLNAFAQIDAKVPTISRNGRSLADQFDYRYSLSDAKDLALLRAVFGRAFGFVTVSSPVPGTLQRIEDSLKTKTGHKSGPFKFI